MRQLFWNNVNNLTKRRVNISMFPKLAYIEDIIKKSDRTSRSKSCLVLRNTIIEGIEPYLRYLHALDDIDLNIVWGHYDNIVQDAWELNKNSGWSDVDTIVVWLWLDGILTTTSSHSGKKTHQDFERIDLYCKNVINGIRSNTNSIILWMGFEATVKNSLMQSDSNQDIENTLACSLNSKVKEYLSEAKNAYFVSTQACLERVGENSYYDWRYWYSSRAPFSRDAMSVLAIEMGKHFRNLNGCVRKLLILDADNTLWGGVVGEDGADGIEVGDTKVGQAYTNFQNNILELRQSGVVLALCSKNNYGDVLEAFNRNPHMPLALEHFSAVKVNWEAKPTNIIKICSELNLGLSSVVFVDDSDYEINLVKEVLPEVIAIRVDPERPYLNKQRLLEHGWFDKYAITSEDLIRADMYRSESKRKELKDRSVNLETFLESLELEAHITFLSEDDVARAAQLCQRTNQFNLTTVRHTVDQIQQLGSSSENILFGVKLRDKFGAYGMVGFSHICVDGANANIESFLLSCRALGRGVERAILASLVKASIDRGCVYLFGKYVKSSKNQMVESFYMTNAFDVVKKSDNETTFRINLSNTQHLVVPSFIKTVIEL